jgi:hypothetical protein
MIFPKGKCSKSNAKREQGGIKDSQQDLLHKEKRYKGDKTRNEQKANISTCFCCINIVSYGSTETVYNQCQCSNTDI